MFFSGLVDPQDAEPDDEEQEMRNEMEEEKSRLVVFVLNCVIYIYLPHFCVH